MIADRYLLYVCPDADCERWDIERMRCDNHHEHDLEEPPMLVELLVAPVGQLPVECRQPPMSKRVWS